MISLPSLLPLSLSIHLIVSFFLFDLRLSSLDLVSLLVLIVANRYDRKATLRVDQSRLCWLRDEDTTAVSATVARSADFSGTVTPHPWRSLGTFVVTKKRGGTEGTSPSRVYLFANRFSPSSAPRADYPSSPFHTAARVYTCVQPRVESILPSLSLLHLFSTYLRPVFSLLLEPRSTNEVSPSLLARWSDSSPHPSSPPPSSSSSVVLQNRGIQMTSDDEYPRLSRPAGNCRYSRPYFCPRLRYLSPRRCRGAYHAHAVVGSFLLLLLFRVYTFFLPFYLSSVPRLHNTPCPSRRYKPLLSRGIS